VTVCGSASPAHCSLHVDSAPQDSEHEPVQRTVHVEPAAHDTLLLLPTVTLQSDSPEQLMLHDAPHVPVHVLPIVHARVQLSPLQPESPMSQDEFGGHAHEVPVHSGGGVSLPQPAAAIPIQVIQTRLLVIR
jgi:hypothetical protein